MDQQNNQPVSSKLANCPNCNSVEVSRHRHGINFECGAQCRLTGNIADTTPTCDYRAVGYLQGQLATVTAERDILKRERKCYRELIEEISTMKWITINKALWVTTQLACKLTLDSAHLPEVDAVGDRPTDQQSTEQEVK